MNSQKILQPDSRLSLDQKENGNYLMIGLARLSDEGDLNDLCRNCKFII